MGVFEMGIGVVCAGWAGSVGSFGEIDCESAEAAGLCGFGDRDGFVRIRLA